MKGIFFCAGNKCQKITKKQAEKMLRNSVLAIHEMKFVGEIKISYDKFPTLYAVLKSINSEQV